MKKSILIIMAMLFMAWSAFAFNTNKPDSHNTAWLDLHGKEAAVDDSSCISCHEERLDCIACHEDVRPRSHNNSWAKKGHGMEARWNEQSCKSCHTEDSCISCHETAVPMNHNRAGFGTAGTPGFHCYTGCQLPSGTWKNTVSSNCIVCHTTRPIEQSSGKAHEMYQ